MGAAAMVMMLMAMVMMVTIVNHITPPIIIVLLLVLAPLSRPLPPPSGRVGSSASRRWRLFWDQRQCLLARPRRARPRRARPRRARPRRQARRRALRPPRRGARRRALRQAGRRARPRTPSQRRTRMLTRSRTPTPTCPSQTVRLLRAVQVLLTRLPKTTAAPTAKASPSRPWLPQRRPPRAKPSRSSSLVP